MKLGELTAVHPSTLKDGDLIMTFPLYVMGVIGTPKEDPDKEGYWWIETLKLNVTGPHDRDSIGTSEMVTRLDWDEAAMTMYEDVKIAARRETVADSWSHFTDRLNDGQCRKLLVELLDLGCRLMRSARKITNSAAHYSEDDRKHYGGVWSAHNTIQNAGMDLLKRMEAENTE